MAAAMILVSRNGRSRFARTSKSFFFSGSLYALSFDFLKSVMGPLTPLGGLMMIAGWLGFAREALRRR